MSINPDNICPDCGATMQAAFHGSDIRNPSKRIWVCNSDTCDPRPMLPGQRRKTGVMKKEASNNSLHLQKQKEQLWAMGDHVTFGPPPESEGSV